MPFPFQWVRERQWRAEPGQVLAIEVNPGHILPSVSAQPDWHASMGIVRGVKDGGLLVEDHIREEIRVGRPVEVSRQIAGADEMRRQVWTIDQHKADFAARHPDQKVLAWVGNGNLLSNPHFVGFVDGRPFHLASEPHHFTTRAYTSLVVRRTGTPRVSIEPLRYAATGNGVQISNSTGDDITADVECATFGQQLVRGGQPINRPTLRQMALEQQFYDLRHLFLFGRMPAGNKRWLDAGLAAFWENGILNTDALGRALDGEAVALDVRQFDLAEVRAAMDSKGYDEVNAPAQPGQYSLRSGQLLVALLDGLYPHNMIGIRDDGILISVVLRGLSNRLGVSISGAAEIMCRLGAQDALLLDNGGDVMMAFGDDQVLGSAEGERNRLRSVLLFRAATDSSTWRPEDLRLVVYPKQWTNGS